MVVWQVRLLLKEMKYKTKICYVKQLLRRYKMKKNIKHQHGTPNPIIKQEEEAILAVVNRALESSSNAQIIGRNGCTISFTSSKR